MLPVAILPSEVVPTRSFVLVVTVIVACSVLQWLARDRASAQKAANETYEHVYYLPPADVLEVLALSQDEALADLLWARALVYLGEETIRNQSGDSVLSYGRAVCTLDPYFPRAYRLFGIGAMSRPLKSAEERLPRIRAALEFLEDGIGRLPGDGELAWDTGAAYAYTLAPLLTDEDAHRAAKQRGAEHMQAAALLGAGPAWASLSNASTLVRLGQASQAVAHLKEIYSITNEPSLQAEIERLLAKLQSEAFAEGLRQANEDLRRAHTADFPYLNRDLYLLVGHRLDTMAKPTP